MKKPNILIVLMIFGISLRLTAQSQNELTRILQKCIDLSELQYYYPLDSNGVVKQLNIVQYPVAFPPEISLIKTGNNVVFLTIPEVSEKKLESYFMFRSLQINNNAATVDFCYFYNCIDDKFKMLLIHIEFKKSSSDWNVLNYNLKGNIL